MSKPSLSLKKRSLSRCYNRTTPYLGRAQVIPGVQTQPYRMDTMRYESVFSPDCLFKVYLCLAVLWSNVYVPSKTKRYFSCKSLSRLSSSSSLGMGLLKLREGRYLTHGHVADCNRVGTKTKAFVFPLECVSSALSYSPVFQS